MEKDQLTIYDELSDRITKSDKFNVYFKLIRDEILSSLITSDSTNEIPVEELKFLIESAAILACSSKDKNKQVAILFTATRPPDGLLAKGIFPDE